MRWPGPGRARGVRREEEWCAASLVASEARNESECGLNRSVDNCLNPACEAPSAASGTGLENGFGRVLPRARSRTRSRTVPTPAGGPTPAGPKTDADPLPQQPAAPPSPAASQAAPHLLRGPAVLRRLPAHQAARPQHCPPSPPHGPDGSAARRLRPAAAAGVGPWGGAGRWVLGGGGGEAKAG